MLESLLTISIVGLIVGFLFSVPVAGPISIVITSHALKGESRYCFRVAIGAAIVDFLYCFIAVFGFTHLYLRYERIIPYLLIAGSLLTFYFGIQIMRTRLDLEHLNESGRVGRRMEKIGKKGGFRTGLALNLLNPSLFIGWATSSFIVLSLVASLGFNVGNLDNFLGNQVDTINQIALQSGKAPVMDMQENPLIRPAPEEPAPAGTETPAVFHIANSLAYGFFVSLGTIIWFDFFSGFLVRHWRKLNVKILNRIIQVLGAALCFLGFYLIYIAYGKFPE